MPSYPAPSGRGVGCSTEHPRACKGRGTLLAGDVHSQACLGVLEAPQRSQGMMGW